MNLPFTLSKEQSELELKRLHLQKLIAEGEQAENEAKQALSCFVSSPLGLSVITGAGFLSGMNKSKQSSTLVWLSTVSKHLF
jgi:hypothetical protein